ncbi:MAG TPA: PadR family transcriptional regulator [Candidatus Acidoferrales bacterium]|nr:PadR family transcriptional regulator [Candidatus Acidoferrales bacterium]
MRDPLAAGSPATRRVDEVIRGPIKSKTIFPVLILHLLHEHPDHGYGLMQRIEAVCGDLIAVNTNKIYPLLRRLEERGFVTATWDHPTKRSRRIYSITAAGNERLAKIKGAMLPYLDSIERAVGRLKRRLYQSEEPRAVSRARSSA